MRNNVAKYILAVLMLSVVSAMQPIANVHAGATSVPPQNQSLSPSGTRYYGSPDEFTVISVHYDADTSPSRQISDAYILVNDSTDTSSASDPMIYAYIQTQPLRYYLCIGGVTPSCQESGGNDVSNAWVTMHDTTEAVESADGTTWTITWVFSIFEDAWSEEANVYLKTVDGDDLEDDWEDFANYNIDSSYPVIDTYSADGILFAESPKRATVTQPAVDLLVKTKDYPLSGYQSDIDRVEIVSVNGVTYPANSRPQFTFTGTVDGSGFKEYLYTNLSLEVNQLRNRIVIATIDASENITEEEVIVTYYPPSQIESHTIAHQSGAKTDTQATNMGEPLSSVVDIDTIVTSPGTEGVMCTYFRHSNFTSPQTSLMEPQINYWNAGPILAARAGQSSELDEYSVRCEGRVRPDETGLYEIIAGIGRYDNARVFIDDMETPIIDYTFTPTQNTQVLGTASGTVTLARNAWYNLIVEYKGLIGSGDALDSDFLRLQWIEPRCTNLTGCIAFLDGAHLAFSAGGLTEFVHDFDVEVTLPRGFIYVASSADYYPVDTAVGVAQEPTVYPAAITESNPIQVLTWHVTDSVPVGKSVKFSYQIQNTIPFNLE